MIITDIQRAAVEKFSGVQDPDDEDGVDMG